MTPTPNGWQWELGDSVVYRGKTYRFPGEIVALTTDGQAVVKAYGDMDGNYLGMKHIFGPDQLAPYEFGNGTGSPFLVIDPERDAVAQIRAFCQKHPATASIGMAQLHAIIGVIDGHKPERLDRSKVKERFTTQDGNKI